VKRRKHGCKKIKKKKAIFSHTIGGIVTGVVANILYTVFI